MLFSVGMTLLALSAAIAAGLVGDGYGRALVLGVTVNQGLREGLQGAGGLLGRGWSLKSLFP